jgi:glycosyltransferase involved in cell wall biosynthesis
MTSYPGMATQGDGGGAPSPRLALVHDYLLVMRGAERTFAAIAECWPRAPIFTLLCDPKETARAFAGHPVQASYLQRLGVDQRGFRRLLPFFPHATRRLPLMDYDVIVSSSSAFAHGVRVRDHATHICYCHTPFRYAWYERDQALEELPRPLRPVMERLLARIRRWDVAASKRVDHYIANSQLTRKRIADCYGREATVLHPPVQVDRFEPGRREDYFLVVTEVVRHKRVEVALEAARLAGRQVRVVGSGPDLPRLRQRYAGSADFLGRVSDEELADLYRRARALIVPNVEEFGIAMVEAQAAGTPVVAADAGGAQEAVLPGKTGELVPPGDAAALAEALRHTDFDRFDTATLTEHAARFSPDRFRASLTAEVERLTKERRDAGGEPQPRGPRRKARSAGLRERAG